VTRAVAAALLILVSLLGTACGPSDRRAALVVAVEEDPSSTDPRTGSDQASERLFHLLYRGLFVPGPSLEPVPDLAESCEILSPTRYRIRLRPGLRFSDGRPLTARDAAFTLRSVLDGSIASWRRGDLERLSRIEAPDDRTLDLTLREPFAPLLSVLNLGILPEGTPSHPETPPPGSGPWRLRGHIARQWVFLEANPFAERPPACPTLALKVVPDPVVRALELRRGGVDLVVNDLPPDAAAWFDRPGFRLTRSPGANYAYLGLNCARPPLDRPAVRRALALAVDRDALLKYLQRGLGRPATGLLCPENWAYEPGLLPTPHDPETAARLLGAEGFAPDRDGVRLRLSYKTSMNKVSRQLAVAVQEDLRKIGVRAEIQSLEWGTFYGDVVKGDFDLYGLTWVGVADPDAFRLRFASSAVPPLGLNRGRYASPAVDALLETGSREADRAARRAAYSEVQRRLADDLPYISLWWPDNVAASRAGLAPFTIPPDGSFRFLADVRWEESPTGYGESGR